MSRLYTYLPKDNTALAEGLLSTALSDTGFEKYRGRTGKYKKDDVLKVLDSWEPEWTRSKAISALTQPIPSDAAEDFLNFAKDRKLYSFDTKDLIKAKILAHIRRARKGGGTDPVDDVRAERLNWHRKKKHLLFQGVPHYFVETTGGKIPPEFVREEKMAATKDIGFPKDEIKGLEGNDSIVTHRVSDDAEKYETGDIVKSPWGDRYEVADRKDISKVDDSPYYKYLTDSQKALLKVYDRIAVLRLKKTEKKASDEDIEAKARLHYPEEGSHGWNHIQDVIASARRMRRRELLKKELAAIMYHDSSLMTGDRETHADDSAEIARRELAGFFRKKQLDDIVNAIAHHRASYEGKRSSRLEDLVAAADRPVPNLARQIARSWKYHEELGEPEELRAANAASHLKDKYGHGGYAYSNAPKLYIKTYGKELKDIMSKFDGLTPESVKSMMSGQSE